MRAGERGAGGARAGGGAALNYRWIELPTTGPAPATRELHAAFVRPAVVQLLEDAALAGGLRHRAMEWVQQNYDWQRLCARAVSLVQSSLDEAICS